MGKSDSGDGWVEVESCKADFTGGLHGDIHVRSVLGGPFSPDLRVECPKDMKNTRIYPCGTRFRIWAMLKHCDSGTVFLYTSWRWTYEVLSP